MYLKSTYYNYSYKIMHDIGIYRDFNTYYVQLHRYTCSSLKINFVMDTKHLRTIAITYRTQS